jgi:hypothetical protein
MEGFSAFSNLIVVIPIVNEIYTLLSFYKSKEASKLQELNYFHKVVYLNFRIHRLSMSFVKNWQVCFNISMSTLISLGIIGNEFYSPGTGMLSDTGIQCVVLVSVP